MAKYQRGISWTAVILGLIFCWPLGLFLLIKKARTDRESAVKKDTKTSVTGWLLLFIGLSLFGTFSGAGRNNTVMLFFAIFILCGGFVSLITTRRNNLDGYKYRCYIDGIVNHGLTSLQDIANFVQIHEKQVVKDLKQMIKMGYFDHAHIDEKLGEIHIFQRRPHVHHQDPYYEGPRKAEASFRQADQAQAQSGSDRSSRTSEQNATDAVELLMACRSCGAQNWIVPGARNHCDFCGSPLG
ncbi:MAG: hypothetical protein FWH28_06565 [Clostridiales bacterium]|nr:hypothetical protein [Clostridiales bacterium]